MRKNFIGTKVSVLCLGAGTNLTKPLCRFPECGVGGAEVTGASPWATVARGEPGAPAAAGWERLYSGFSGILCLVPPGAQVWLARDALHPLRTKRGVLAWLCRLLAMWPGWVTRGLWA